ncbi:hypothetical protein BSKO_03685 [Bryopsis sp. KO-2023]|nr:hypothetical protein BSKO_03685 [Bryopsis sp. KO-2023]
MMDSEPGSRDSQDSTLVGAFRPQSRPSQKSSTHVACTPIPPTQQRVQPPIPTGHFSVSSSWESHSTWREWAHHYKKKGYKTLNNSTGSMLEDAQRQEEDSERRNRVACHFDDPLFGSYGLQNDATLAEMFMGKQGRGQNPFHPKGNRGHCLNPGQAMNVLPELPVMTPMRPSRSMDSLRELQVLRASSSVSLVSNGGLDFEGGISVPSFCKVPLTERFDLAMSVDTSLNSLDVSSDAGPAISPDRMHVDGPPQNFRHGDVPRNFIDHCGNMHSQRSGLHEYLPVTDGVNRSSELTETSENQGNLGLPDTTNGRNASDGGSPDVVMHSNEGTSAHRISVSVGLPPPRTGRQYRSVKDFRSGSNLLGSASVDLMSDNVVPELDPYGFILHTYMPGIAPPCARISTKEKKLEQRRLDRWKALVGKSESWEAAFNRNPSTTKKLVRNGIPDEFRGDAWLVLSGGQELRDANPGVYEHQLTQPCDAEHLIRRDLHRTFPNHVYFQNEGGPGQQALFNVLKAYAVYDPEVCYVQGMGSIVAVLLLFMQEEDSFWTFVALMKPPVTVHNRRISSGGSRPLFVQGLPLCRKLTLQFDYLLQNKCSRLSRSLRNEGYEPAMYATKWWMTMFTFSLPFSHVVRVWDIFMLEGWKMGIRVGLAIMKTLGRKLTGQPFDRLVERITPEYLADVISPADGFIKMALKTRVSRGLRKWEKIHRDW